MRTPSSASNHLTLAIPIHSVPPNHPSLSKGYLPVSPSEALTHDWNKYRSTVIATAGVDRLIRTFDIRAPDQGPLAIIPGHDFAIRRISWSPHLSNVLLSASYDMTCRVWSDCSTKELPVNPPPKSRTDDLVAPFDGGKELKRMGQHTEFVMGVDWCLFGDGGWCATCGWDEKVFVWDAKSVP